MLLDINDLAIRALPGETPASVGVYAQSAAGGSFGDAALAQLRLYPTLCEDRYWRDLGTQPPGKSLHGIRHNADLAWRHLSSLSDFALSEIQTLAMPAHYTDEQAALLSGILKNLGVESATILHRSLLCLASSPNAEYHLDIQLHQSVLSRATRSNNQLTVEDFQVIPGMGLFQLVDSIMRAAQQVFVDKTRFDPLHQAVTEQQLFDQIIERLGSSIKQAWTLNVDANGGRYQIELSTNAVRQVCRQWAQPLNLDPAHLVVDANLPAVIEELDALVLGTRELTKTWSANQASLLPSQGFEQITSLPLTVSTQEDAQPPEDALAATSENSTQSAEHGNILPAVPAGSPVTHALTGGTAWPLEQVEVFALEGRLALGQTGSEQITVARFVPSAAGWQVKPVEAVRLNGARLNTPCELSDDDTLASDQYAGSVHFIRVINLGDQAS